MNPEEARQAIEKDKQKRQEECREALNELLQKHNCRLDIAVILKKGYVEPVVNIIANE